MRKAPSSRMVSPFSIGLVMIDATSCAYSSGRPSRLGNGTCWPSESCTFCGRPSSIGVMKMPGAIVTTRIADCARSRATGSVIPATPALDAPYAAWPICPSNAATEAVLMITPRSSPISSAVTSRAANFDSTLNVPIRFTSITLRNSDSACGLPSRLTVRDGGAMPAQFTSTRATPCAASAAATAASTLASSVTSTRVKVPPNARARASPRSASRSNSATLAPPWASMAAVAAPSPDAPPVTIAATPSICMFEVPPVTVAVVYFLDRPHGKPAPTERAHALAWQAGAPCRPGMV